ncbi:MAG: hypothetical protein C4521_02745 [Actinobacteria bacterium]|nr:MAG: hypothetical protein C4521_02745 [Actinomycetota bacterium]
MPETQVQVLDNDAFMMDYSKQSDEQVLVPPFKGRIAISQVELRSGEDWEAKKWHIAVEPLENIGKYADEHDGLVHSAVTYTTKRTSAMGRVLAAFEKCGVKTKGKTPKDFLGVEGHFALMDLEIVKPRREGDAGLLARRVLVMVDPKDFGVENKKDGATKEVPLTEELLAEVAALFAGKTKGQGMVALSKSAYFKSEEHKGEREAVTSGRALDALIESGRLTLTDDGVYQAA